MKVADLIHKLGELSKLSPDAEVEMADGLPVVDPVLVGDVIIITDQEPNEFDE